MEFSKLTICRQDVVVVSDTEPQSGQEPGTNKKKCKSKVKCVRKVQLTRMTVDRIVPNCYRQRCRHAHYYHRMNAKTTKYTKRKDSFRERAQSETEMTDSSSVEPRVLSTPITVESGSDTLDVVSLCSFNPVSSDSDVLEDLIKVTRQRMKNEEGKFNNKLFNTYSPGASAQDFYKNESADVGVDNNSIYPMRNLVFHHNVHVPSPAIIPENTNHFTRCKNQDNRVSLLCSTRHNGIEVAPTKSVSPLSHQSDRSLSPLYEISGKVFMEHYLNTSIF